MESSLRKTGEYGSQNSETETVHRQEVNPSPSSGLCSFPRQRATQQFSYAVMRPGDSSRVHTHPGPEGWYVLAGEQCLETGATLRRAFALVIHDSAQPRGIPSDWKPTGACSP